MRSSSTETFLIMWRKQKLLTNLFTTDAIQTRKDVSITLSDLAKAFNKVHAAPSLASETKYIGNIRSPLVLYLLLSYQQSLVCLCFWSSSPPGHFHCGVPYSGVFLVPLLFLNFSSDLRNIPRLLAPNWFSYANATTLYKPISSNKHRTSSKVILIRFLIGVSSNFLQANASKINISFIPSETNPTLNLQLHLDELTPWKSSWEETFLEWQLPPSTSPGIFTLIPSVKKNKPNKQTKTTITTATTTKQQQQTNKQTNKKPLQYHWVNSPELNFLGTL